MNNYNFLYKNNKINNNKLKEDWFIINQPNLYNKILIFKKELNINVIRFSQLFYHFKQNLLEYPKCELCNNLNKRFIGFETGYKLGCSRHCAILLTRKQSNKTREENTLKKHGVKHTNQLKEVKEKKKKTNNIRYGGNSPTKSKKVVDKIIKTNNERFGCDFPLQNKDILNKTINGFIDKWGEVNPMKTDEIKNKIKNNNNIKLGIDWHITLPEIIKKSKETTLNNYGVDCIFKLKDFSKESWDKKYIKLNKYYQDLIGDNYIKYDTEKKLMIIKCKENHIYEISSTLYFSRVKNNRTCTICNPVNNKITNGHYDLINFFKENKIEIEINTFDIIKPYEIDIYLPHYKIAIEFNGIFWHSSLYKNNNYHKMKYELCKEKGIKLIQIWEDYWNQKQNIIKSIILNKINNKLFINNYVINIIDDNTCLKFLLDYNIYGYYKCEYNYGIIYNNQLVSIICINNNKIERFCNKIGYNLDFSILFNYCLNIFGNLFMEIDNDFFSGSFINMKLIKVKDNIVDYKKYLLYKSGISIYSS